MRKVLALLLLTAACSTTPMEFREQPGFVYMMPQQQAFLHCKAEAHQVVSHAIGSAVESPISEMLNMRGTIANCMEGMGYITVAK